jgi:hypothetical protein
MSTTVSSGLVTYNISPSGSLPVFNAYRLIISGTTASGIVDWAITGMFTDFSAMGIGSNATDANGGIGQLNLANPRVITISGGNYTESVNSVLNPPDANVKSNSTFIG